MTNDLDVFDATIEKFKKKHGTDETLKQLGAWMMGICEEQGETGFDILLDREDMHGKIVVTIEKERPGTNVFFPSLEPSNN